MQCAHNVTKQVSIENPGKTDTPPKSFTFDAVYDVDTQQKFFYEESCYQLIESVMDGFNGAFVWIFKSESRALLLVTFFDIPHRNNIRLWTNGMRENLDNARSHPPPRTKRCYSELFRPHLRKH